MKELVKKINGNMVWVTPMLVTISVLLLGWIRTDLYYVNKHFTNHLIHHQDLEVGYERRLTKIEGNRFTDKDASDLKKELLSQLPPNWLIDKIHRIEYKVDELRDE